MNLRLFVVLAMSLILAGCFAAAPRHKLHYTLLESPAERTPKKLVLLTPSVTVREISAGGVTEKVPEWTKTASANVATALHRYFKTRKDVVVVDAPRLTTEQQHQLDEYLALYDLVAGTAFVHTGTGVNAWPHKTEHFDYSLGNGLKLLKQKTGADAAVVVVGEDHVSSAGRKAAAFVAAALGANLQMGHSFLSAGIIDLSTGDVLWLNYDFAAQSRDLREQPDADAMIENMFKDYPGLDAYAKAKAKKL